MKGRPSGRRLVRLTVVGMVAVALTTPLAAVQAVGQARPAGLVTAATDPVVGVELTLIEPVTVRPERRLRVGGVVTTDRSLRDVTVQLSVGTQPYEARSTLSDAAAAPAPDLTALAPLTAVPGAVDDLGRLAPGRTPFLVQTRTDLLPLGAAGVYPLRLTVTAVRDSVTETVASVDTFLPWSPSGVGVRPTRLLWVWPLVDQPHRDSQGSFTDDDLAAELAPDGRLTALVDAATGREVTWLVDPALLADTEALTRPPRDPDSVVSRDDAAAGRRWLTDLRSATGTSDVLALPYGDPDLVSVTSANRTGLLLAGRALGDQVTRAVLGRPARFDLVWPADGFADDATLSSLADTGSSSVLLSGEAVPITEPPPWTPSGRVDLADGRLAGLLSDPALDAVVADPGDGPDALLLARQLFLAQTLLLTVELPSDPRLAVVTPPRRWDPAPGWAEILLDATERAAWLRPVRVDVATGRAAPEVAREDPQLPEDVAQLTLPTEVPDTAAQARRPLVRFRGILTDPRPADDYEQALLGSLSTAWRPTPDVTVDQLADTVDRLTADRGKVRIVSRGATLSAESATLPVTVRNQLDQAVKVRLAVTSQDALRLRVSVPDELLLIEAGGTQSVSVELDAVTSGRLSVAATLLTPRGLPYAAPVSIPIDVRAYGQVALIVFGLAAGLLVLAAAVRIGRRIRSSRRTASDERRE